jgi:DNA-binding CsgD family transcriptional regulator
MPIVKQHERFYELDSNSKLQIAQLKQAGFSNKQISEMLRIDEHQVEIALMRIRSIQDSLARSRGMNRWSE